MDQPSLDLQRVTTVEPRRTYEVDIYEVTPEGLRVAGLSVIRFVKGDKSDPGQPRQDGFTTETLLSVCRAYLNENNLGDLHNEFTTQAVAYINFALVQLEARALDRAKRGVQGTYQK